MGVARTVYIRRAVSRVLSSSSLHATSCILFGISTSSPFPPFPTFPLFPLFPQFPQFPAYLHIGDAHPMLRISVRHVCLTLSILVRHVRLMLSISLFDTSI